MTERRTAEGVDAVGVTDRAVGHLGPSHPSNFHHVRGHCSDCQQHREPSHASSLRQVSDVP